MRPGPRKATHKLPTNFRGYICSRSWLPLPPLKKPKVKPFETTDAWRQALVPNPVCLSPEPRRHCLQADFPPVHTTQPIASAPGARIRSDTQTSSESSQDPTLPLSLPASHSISVACSCLSSVFTQTLPQLCSANLPSPEMAWLGSARVHTPPWTLTSMHLASHRLHSARSLSPPPGTSLSFLQAPTLQGASHSLFLLW